ncbi:hypothetical protein THRCLA_02935 [Thraustotheca clavata]|uniref:Uncharacterized protein n=1 Tax=Thraustotheca clavata TaxID=74557 RepID=A0A1W0A3U8_9STRA|nr:hypothetical protein THRCLA_02935 [Thraustotheca clavata]
MAAGIVLVNSALMQLILSYQDGIYLDLLPRVDEWKHIKTCTAPMVFPGTQFLMYVVPERYRIIPFFQDNLCIFASYSLYLHPFECDIRFPLHIAIFENNLNVVKQWVKCKSTWKTDDAFNLAVQSDHFDIVKYFLDSGYGPRLQARWHQALTLATRNNSYRVLSILMAAQQDQTQKSL